MPSDLSYSKILRGFLNYERNTGQRHPLSLGVRDFKRAVASNPLTDVNGQTWWGNVYVGTPPVAFTIDFDTGSSDFIIPGSRCTNCGSHTRYNPGASSTSVRLRKTFNTEYGDGSKVSGSLFNDTITIAGLTAARQTLGAATKFSRGFNDLVDGILGMAFRSISEYNANPVFLNLAAQGQTTSPIFAMKLTAAGSELTLGGLNSALYTGDITWVPVTEQAHWQITFDSLQVGGQVIVGSSPCIIDSVCINYSLLTLLD
jgi:cathepsin D